MNIYCKCGCGNKFEEFSKFGRKRVYILGHNGVNNKGKNNGMYGKIAWNNGTKGIMKKNSGSFTLGQTAGYKNINWRGESVKYHALHSWLYRNLGKANKCENIFCPNKSSYFEWANKDHSYKRNLNDWMQLCSSCHKRYDLRFIKRKEWKFQLKNK